MATPIPAPHPDSSTLQPQHRPMPGWTLQIALQLGRVSNLPTVWTNTLAAVLIAGGSDALGSLAMLLLAMSLAYIGGMYLNDAFDGNIDAIERPERPIPSGAVGASAVFAAGAVMLAAAVIIVALTARANGLTVPATVAVLLLAGCIVLYNAWHKGNPLSPLLMGLCRVMVYISCALAVSASVPAILLMGACITLSYLIGLTYTAKQENLGELRSLWPLAFLAAPAIFGAGLAGFSSGAGLAGFAWLTWACVAIFSGWTLACLRLILLRRPGELPRAVVRLIAGISLVDALLITSSLSSGNELSTQAVTATVLCLMAFGLTLVLQRYVSGT